MSYAKKCLVKHVVMSCAKTKFIVELHIKTKRKYSETFILENFINLNPIRELVLQYTVVL